MLARFGWNCLDFPKRTPTINNQKQTKSNNKNQNPIRAPKRNHQHQIISDMFRYFQIFSDLFTYFQIFSNIFKYFQTSAPKQQMAGFGCLWLEFSGFLAVCGWNYLDLSLFVWIWREIIPDNSSQTAINPDLSSQT